MPPDVRYRDACITGAKLDQVEFDQETSEVIAEENFGLSPTPAPAPSPGIVPTPNYTPDWTVFHQRYVGKVSGAKPPIGTCMPLRDTPKIATNFARMVSNPNTAFTHYLNMDDAPFTYTSQPVDIYNASNYYRSKTFFIGGTDEKLNCEDIVGLAPGFQFDDDPDSIPYRAEYQRIKAENCYNFYILSHSIKPWRTMERPGFTTDDPLSYFDPKRAFLNSCQPIINGVSAEEVTILHWERETGLSLPDDPRAAKVEENSGYAPVWRYKFRADMDEAEYLLSTYLQKAWIRNFKTGPGTPHGIPIKLSNPQTFDKNFVYPKISLPCVQNYGAGGQASLRTPSQDGNTANGVFSFGDNSGIIADAHAAGAGNCSPAIAPAPAITPAPAPAISPAPAPTPGPGPMPAPAPCEPPYRWIPDAQYYSPPSPQYYCPNVEKITEPSHPFSPRNFMVNNDINGAIPAFFDDPDGHLTDRDYSWATTDCVYNCPMNITRRGYTTYEPYNCETGEVITTSPWVTEGEVDNIKRIRHPTVQCAIVPVDVLEFRDEAFYTCIMQRINHNFNDWIDHGMPDPDTSGWIPPCKTKFWETDTVEDCPVKMSIQQCCHTILKDVVPANFVKLRTCEGLMQTRRDDAGLQEDLCETFGITEACEGGASGGGGGSGSGDQFYGTYVTDDNCPAGFPGCMAMTGGGIPSYGAYDLARRITQRLNEDQCYETEPSDYQFKQYFGEFWYPQPDEEDPETYTWEFVGYHMPYMRWWDTGVAAGNPRHGGSYLNVLGGFDTLIGVGREERDFQTAKELAEYIDDFNDDNGVTVEDESGDLANRLSEEQPSQMGRVGGWMELKAHQMWSIRRSNLFCVGRYEKLFKPGGPEQLALAKAGAGYTSMVHKQWPWTLGWRGYVTDWNNPGNQFPHFPYGAPGMAFVSGGLDNALPGDIIVYTINGLKQIAYVTDIGFDVPNRKDATFDYENETFELGGQPIKPNRVFVVSWDQGKFPTSAGSTLNSGIGPERTIYKNRVPDNYRDNICGNDFRALTDSDPLVFDCRDGFDIGQCSSLDCQPSCEDPDYSACVLPNSSQDWNNAMIYRPRRMIGGTSYADVRACNGYITQNPGTYNMAETYSWTGWSGDPENPLPASPNVIYQNKTHQVGSDLWGYCVNAGWDPPAHFSKEYKGPQTGAMTDTTLCGPEWGDCAAPPKAETKFFP